MRPESDLPSWSASLFASHLAPRIKAGDGDGDVLVWEVAGDNPEATISEQFTTNAETYHARNSSTAHFLELFRQALAATGLDIASRPTIFDLGSGPGANSVVPCLELFDDARIVATDLSAELLAILARYVRQSGAASDVICVVMDAMSPHLAAESFDLVTGAAILHHLERPLRGIEAAARALRPGGHALFFEPFNGWGVMRLAYERILAEADLRNDPLDPRVDANLRAMVSDIALRSQRAPDPAALVHLDDKWLFSRAAITKMARTAGFKHVDFVPHNDHPTLYHDATAVNLRLATGESEVPLPPWATDILRSFDAALTLQAKRELMLEGTIVLTKG